MRENLFGTEETRLVLGDSFKILTKMLPESVDMIFADPPPLCQPTPFFRSAVKAP